MMRNILIGLITIYRTFLSPLLPPTCRFYPTCSAYGLEALQRYGALQGSWLTVCRILRCHPFSPGGYDPVVSCAGAQPDKEKI